MTPPMRHCFNCGAALGAYADWGLLDTCGRPECEREAREWGREGPDHDPAPSCGDGEKHSSS